MTDSATTDKTAPARQPAMDFWPRERMAQICLIFCMAFGFFMAVLLGSTVPPFWGPDEDYHWNYTSHLSEKGSIADPNKPFYSPEWNEALVAMNFNQFGTGPAGPTALTGDPAAVDQKFEQKFGEKERQPTGEPTRPVVHAPLYHSAASVMNKPFAGKSVFTRLWIGRLTNAFIALLIVFAAWVLAAQVFTREGPRLFVAGLAAAQPMINYATGTMTNDAVLIAFFTLAIAALVTIVKNPPDPQQGRFAGIFIALALLSKSSALILAPIALTAFALQYARHKSDRDAKSVLGQSFAWAVGIPVVFAGWFYVYLVVKYGSLTGSVAPINPPVVGPDGSIVQHPITSLPGFAAEWMRRTYSTYWSHYVYWEGPRGSIVFYVPMLLGLTGILGLGAWAVRIVRADRWKTPLFSQATFLLGTALLILFPWFAADMMRSLDGHGMAFNGGRFIMPAYPAVAVLFVLGIAELVKRRSQLLVFSAIAAVAVWEGVYMWKLKTLDRYFGGEGITSVGQELLRASFFRPEWVTKNFLWAVIFLAGLSAVAGWIFGVLAARRDGPPGREL